MTITADAAVSVHQLRNGHGIVYEGKTPLAGHADYAVQFEDGTDVFVVGDHDLLHTYVNFCGVGQLCVGTNMMHSTHDGSCMLGDLRIKWQGKVLKDAKEHHVSFTDGSYVEVGSNGRRHGEIIGTGIVCLTR